MSTYRFYPQFVHFSFCLYIPISLYLVCNCQCWYGYSSILLFSPICKHYLYRKVKVFILLFNVYFLKFIFFFFSLARFSACVIHMLGIVVLIMANCPFYIDRSISDVFRSLSFTFVTFVPAPFFLFVHWVLSTKLSS